MELYQHYFWSRTGQLRSSLFLAANHRWSCLRVFRLICGRHATRANKIPAETVAQIDGHIRSFPRRRSHYSRSDNQKRYYLSSRLNINKLYRLYLAKYEPEQYRLYEDGRDINPKVSYNFYYRHFTYNYNISFQDTPDRTPAKNVTSLKTALSSNIQACSGFAPPPLGQKLGTPMIL